MPLSVCQWDLALHLHVNICSMNCKVYTRMPTEIPTFHGPGLQRQNQRPSVPCGGARRPQGAGSGGPAVPEGGAAVHQPEGGDHGPAVRWVLCIQRFCSGSNAASSMQCMAPNHTAPFQHRNLSGSFWSQGRLTRRLRSGRTASWLSPSGEYQPVCNQVAQVFLCVL